MAGIWDEVDSDIAADPSKLTDAPSQPSIWDEVDNDLKAQQDQANAAAARRSIEAIPEQYADHLKLAKTFGVGVDYVGRNEQALKKFAGFQDVKRMMDANPPLAKWYTTDDNAAAIKVDELEHLSGLSWLGQSFGQAAVAGYHSTDRAMLRYKQLMGSATADDVERANQMQLADAPRDYGADSFLQRGWVGAAGQLANLGSSLVGSFAGGMQGATAGGAAALVAGQLGPQVALPEELVTVPAAMAAGYGYGAFAGQALSSFKLESGSAYEEFSGLRDETGKPLPDEVARGAAIVAGAANSMLETLSFRKMASTVPGLDKLSGTMSRDAIKQALMRPSVRAALGEFAKNIAETGVTEVSTEVAQEAITIFAGEAAKGVANMGEDGQQFAYTSAADIKARLGDTFAQTLETMAVMGPALSSTRLGHDVHRSFQAGRDAAVLRAIGAHAEGNELNERLPEKAKEAVRAITANGPVQNVYIAPEAFSTYFQTSEEASKFAAAVGLTDEYNEAHRTGRDMEVPFDTYYVNIAGTEIGKAIEQHVKFSPDNMTVSEAEQFNLDWDEAQRRLQEDYTADQTEDKAALEGEERVFDDVKTKAMDAGIVPDQAVQYAKLYSTFFRVMSERTGMDAQALYEKYGLSIKRAVPQDTNYKPVDNTDLALEAVRRGRVSPLRKMVEKAAGPSLLDAVIARGGMVDAGGELAAMNAPKRLIRGGTAGGQTDLVGKQENQYGADDVARQMWEEGYFPEFEERPTPNDLFDAIREEMAGTRRTSAMYDQTNEPAVQQAQGLVAFADMLDKLGLDPATMSNDEIKKALDDAVNNDPNADAYFQAAWHGSPHEFDRFSLDHIGSGEGNQAYGWGLYFASSRAVSEWYRAELAGKSGLKIGGEAVDVADPLGAVDENGEPLLLKELRPLLKWPEGATKADGNAPPADFFDKNMGWLATALNYELRQILIETGSRSLDKVMTERRSVVASSLAAAETDFERAEAYVHEAILNALEEKGLEQGKPGRLYKVDVPDAEELMDWDKPLTEQPAGIKAKLATLGFKEKPLPKIADPEVALLVRQALKQADGDPEAIGMVIDNDQAMYNRALRLIKRAGANVDETDVGEWIEEQAAPYRHALYENRKLTGSAMYAELSSRLGDDVDTSGSPAGWGNTGQVGNTVARRPNPRAASEAMRAVGIPGHQYVGHESQTTNYVIYDDSRVNVTEHFQSDEHFATLAEEKALAKQMLDDLKATKSAGGQADKEATTAAFNQMRKAGAARDALAEDLAKTDNGIELVNSKGDMHAAVTKSQNGGGGWRVTHFNDSGFLGHTEHKTKLSAVKEALQEGFDKEDAGALARAVATRTFFQSAEGRDAFIEAEKIITAWTRGDINAAEARKQVKAMGWDLGPSGLRGKYTEIELVDPEGNVHRTYGQEKGTKRGSIQIAPGRTVVNLFDQADLSTFLHESGHFFLEVFRDLAAAGSADETLAADWQATREYLGITDDTAISTEAHEKFARTFEAYLFEGKSPSNEVATIMARFRSWLAFVYKSVKSLNVPINDKIRGVMDRLIATDDEIAAARHSPDFRPAFKDAAEAGMTDKQWADYVGVAGRAVERARRELDAKMMQEVSRETTREWRAARKSIREAVTSELSKLPVYQTIAYLRTGQGGPEGERVFLDRDSIRDLMGEGAVEKMPRGTYRVEGGVHPDILAELMGFKSGHEMLTLMMSVPAIGKAAADETALRMKQQFGDLMGDAVARARATDEAIQNDETGALLNAEIAVLVKKGLATSSVSKADARRAAREMVRSKTIREALRSKLYQNANLKAALEAERAIAKGDWTGALAAKKRQLLNHYAAMESTQAEKDVTKAVAYLNRFAGRKVPSGIAPEHIGRIQQLLARFDLRASATLTDEQRNASFESWVQAQEAQGNILAIDELMRNDGFRKPYRAMTVDDLLAVQDAVKSIAHLGRLATEEAAAELRAKADEVVAAVAASKAKLKERKTRNPTMVDNVLSNVRSMDSSLLKMEQFMAILDGDDINGPLSRYVFRPIAEAQGREADMQREYAARFAAIVAKLDAKRLMERITIPGLSQTFTRSEIMTVALNMGTESNMDKMLRGEGWDTNPAIVDRIVSHLNEAELHAVQETWDLIGRLWPEIAALYKRLSGAEPGKVEHRAVEINGVKLKGGYFPMKYDPSRDFEVAQREAAMTDLLGESTYLRPQTSNGFSKERKQAYARPVMFTLEVAGKHLLDVIHDLTHREAIINADKLLQNGAIRAEIIQRWGVEYYNQFRPWLQSIAADTRADDGLDLPNRFLRGIRSRATVMGLGLRYSTLITQVAGYSNSLEKVTLKHLAGAMRDFFGGDGAGVFAVGAAAGTVVGGPVLGVAAGTGSLAAYTAIRSRLGMANNMISMTRDVMALSAEMRHRAATRDRDIRAQIRQIEGKETLSAQVQHFAFAGIGYMDMAVTVPTWMGAYREHLASHPADKDGAVAHADQVVRLTQGAGGPKDLAAVQRGQPAFQLLTQFYSYFSAYYARQRAWGRDMAHKVATGEGSFPDLLARQVFLTIAPAVMTELLLGRGPSGDDDDGYAKWAAKKILLYPFNAIPLVGPAVNSIGSPFGYSITPSARTIEETVIAPTKLISKIWEGKASAREVVKQTIETTGYIAKLPLGQVATSVDNVWKALEKDDFQLSDLMVSKPKK